MKKRDFYLPSSDGKSRLHCVEWLPDEAESQAIKLWVQLVHGMNEHMGRYGEFASFLAEHGIAMTVWAMGIRLLMAKRSFRKKNGAFLRNNMAVPSCFAICTG